MGLPLEKALHLALLERTWALCVLLGRANTGPLYHLSGTGGALPSIWEINWPQD